MVVQFLDCHPSIIELKGKAGDREGSSTGHYALRKDFLELEYLIVAVLIFLVFVLEQARQCMLRTS
jgi:hypothetical protein